MEQLTITGGTRETTLTIRQNFALQAIEHAGGLTSTELGALLHERRKKHLRDKRCPWCADDGHDVGVELRAKKLVVCRRGTGRWESLRLSEGAKVEAATSAQTNAIPF